MVRLAPLEEDEQRTCAHWLDINLPPDSWFHVPNGNRLRKAQAGINKAIGVKAGVPDIWIIEPPPKFPKAPGCVVELKREVGGKTSEDQLRWLKRMDALGWIVSVRKGAGDAIEFWEMLGYRGMRVWGNQ